MAASQRARGRHVFDIDVYGLQKGLGVGKFIRSTEFTVGGYKWCIRYYPDGAGAEESKEYFSVFLELVTKKAKVRASYSFSLEIPPTRQSSSGSYKKKWSSTKVFNSVSPTSGYPKFKKWSELEASPNHIRIICDVTVIKETRVAFEVQVPPSDLKDNLRELLETKEGANVKINVNGTVVYAHCFVLKMRSPVLKKQLQNCVWKLNIRKIKINDVLPDVFDKLLHFIYTDSLPSLDDLDGDKRKEMVKHLFVAADKYKMERMKMMCAAILYKSLHVETVVTTYALADKHQCSELKDGCVQFIASSNRMDDIMKSQGCVDLGKSHPAVLIDLLKKVCLAK